MTNIWFPVAPGTTSLPPAPTAATNATPLPVNSAYLPGDWDDTAPDLNYLFTTILDTNSDAVYPSYVDGGTLIPPYIEKVPVLARTRTTLSIATTPYALVLPAVDAALVTRTTASLPPVPTRVSGTLAPVLGATQADAAAADTAGWSLLFDDTDDEGDTLSETFVSPVYIGGTSYTACYVTSNQYLTFGSSSIAYASLSATVPAVVKIHLGAGDWSYQRVYQLNNDASTRIRWEGNSDYEAVAGDSNRFLEVAFFVLDDGTQFVEVRAGSIGGSASGPLMVATATTALATATFAANQSWVFEGNADGSTWTAYTGQHIELV